MGLSQMKKIHGLNKYDNHVEQHHEFPELLKEKVNNLMMIETKLFSFITLLYSNYG